MVVLTWRRDARPRDTAGAAVMAAVVPSAVRAGGLHLPYRMGGLRVGHMSGRVLYTVSYTMPLLMYQIKDVATLLLWSLPVLEFQFHWLAIVIK